MEINPDYYNNYLILYANIIYIVNIFDIRDERMHCCRNTVFIDPQ